MKGATKQRNACKTLTAADDELNGNLKPPPTPRANSATLRPGDDSPEFGRIRDAVRRFGTSRSWIYREAPDTPGLLIKAGRSSLVNYRVMRAKLASLPAAEIGAAGRRRAESGR